jgi:hypothetical protein
VSASESEIESAAVTCSDCGRKSIWRMAFTEVRDRSTPRPVCPHCMARRHVRARRSEFITLVIYAALASFFLTIARGQGLGLVIVGFFLFLAALYPLTLLHEAGHALAARLVGTTAFAVVVGHEPWLIDRNVFGVRLKIAWLPSGGVTYHAPCSEPHAVARNITIAAAGPVTNLLIAVLASVAAAGMTGSFEHSIARFALVMVAVASSVQFIWNLWPHEADSIAGKLPSDGARILALLRAPLAEMPGAAAAAHYFRALFALEDRAFETAANESAKARAESRDPRLTVAVTVMEAAARLESDDARGALELLRPLHESPVDDPGLCSAVLDNLAWAYLLIDEPGSIDSGLALVVEARDIVPWEDAYVVCHACLLAASATHDNGRASEARSLLATLKLWKIKRQSEAYAALAQGLCAVADGDLSAARKYYENAKSRGATAAPLRLLERRLASL